MIVHEDFESLDIVEKMFYVLGSELWESKLDGLLSLVKEYIVYMYICRRCYNKNDNFDSGSAPSLHFHFQSSLG